MRDSLEFPRVLFLNMCLLLSSVIGAGVALFSGPVLRTVPDLGDGAVLGLSGLTAVILGAGVLAKCRKQEWFSPIYFVSFLFLLVFVLRPVQLLYSPVRRLNILPEDSVLFAKTIWVGCLGFVGFCLGYFGFSSGSLVRRLPVFSNRWSHKRLVLIAVVYLTLGMAGYVASVARSGGFALFLTTLQGRTLIGKSGNWALGWTMVLIHVTAILLGAYFFKTRRLRVLFLLSLLLSISAGLLLGGRSGVLVHALALVVVFYYSRIGTPRLNGLFIVGFAVIAVLFTVGLGSARGHTSRGGGLPGVSSRVSVVGGEVLDNFVDEFSQFDWFMVVLDAVPSQIPYKYGETFLEFFAMFVPRSLWAEKPLPIGYLISKTLRGVSSGTPFTILGELYLNFSVPGVFIGAVIMGVILRASYSYLLDNRNNVAAVFTYAYVFASLHRFFTRSFAPKLFGYVLFMVPAFFALGFVTHWRKESVHVGPESARPS